MIKKKNKNFFRNVHDDEEQKELIYVGSYNVKLNQAKKILQYFNLNIKIPAFLLCTNALSARIENTNNIVERRAWEALQERTKQNYPPFQNVKNDFVPNGTERQ